MIELVRATASLDPRRDTALRLAEAALRAVEAEGATARALRGLDLPTDAFVLAFGKAALGMARSALRVAPRCWGFVVGPALPDEPLGGLRCVVGGHPVPAPGAAEVGRQVLAAAHALGEDDVALCLVSGGGSAMLELPAPGHTMEELAAITRDGLAGAVPIEELNRRRAAASALKGGKLAAALAPARIVNVVISDVPGSPPSLVASGPTWSEGARCVVAACNRDGQDALVEAGTALGLRLGRLEGPIRGEARDAGAALAREARRRLEADPSLDGLVAGGETTVTVVGEGRGGRNGELVAGAARELGDHLLLSLATDGLDGASDSAGALLDVRGLRVGLALGGPLDLALADNDTARWFRTAGLLLHSGPTGTNVADLHLVLR